jgi:hypothetical protein
MERVAMDKHPSLLQKSVNYGQKSFITLAPGFNLIKLFGHNLLQKCVNFRPKRDLKCSIWQTVEGFMGERDKLTGEN